MNATLSGSRCVLRDDVELRFVCVEFLLVPSDLGTKQNVIGHHQVITPSTDA